MTVELALLSESTLSWVSEVETWTSWILGLDRELCVQRNGLSGCNTDGLPDERGKTGHRNGERVGAGGHIVDGVGAVAAGVLDEGPARGGGQSNCGAGNDGVIRI